MQQLSSGPGMQCLRNRQPLTSLTISKQLGERAVIGYQRGSPLTGECKKKGPPNPFQPLIQECSPAGGADLKKCTVLQIADLSVFEYFKV